MPILIFSEDDNLGALKSNPGHLYVYVLDVYGKCLACLVVRMTAGSGGARLRLDYSIVIPSLCTRFLYPDLGHFAGGGFYLDIFFAWPVYGF